MPLKSTLLALAALIGAWPLAPRAQDEERYLVEVIVFARAELRTSYYRWPGEPDTDGAIDLTPTERDESESSLETAFGDAASRRYADPGPVGPTPLIPEEPVFVPIPPEQYRLAEDWQRLADSGEYRPLVHLAWRQPAASFGEPQPVRLHGGGVVAQQRPDVSSSLLLGPAAGGWTVEAIDGTVALERGRFLHLRLDLALHTPAGAGHGHPLDPLTSEHTGSYFTFRLSERRQIQTDVVNYFDHERFGLIALVEKWEPAEPEPSF